MSYNQYRPTGFSLLPDVVKNILIINVLMFLTTEVLSIRFGIELRDTLGLHYFDSQKFEPYQFITYMFMHGNLSHLFFNMFAVWMFGSAIENYWGGKRFLMYYLITGLGAALIHYTIIHFEIRPTIELFSDYIAHPDFERMKELIPLIDFRYIHPQSNPDLYTAYVRCSSAFEELKINPSNQQYLHDTVVFIQQYLEHFKSLPTVVGASGSLFGLLLAFGMLFPNEHVFMLFLPIPIKAKYFVMAYGAIELFSGVFSNPGDNVAHFAHLGGMVFGFLLIKVWQAK